MKPGQNSEITHEDLLTNGWEKTDNPLYPFTKKILDNELTMVVTRQWNDNQFGLLHEPSQVLIIIRTPRTYSELQQFESMILGSRGTKYLMKHDTIINFITTIRESSPINNRMYRQGDCYKFHLILKSFLGNECIPKILTSMHHVISLYQRRLYDITGECDYLPSIYRDLTDEDMEFVQHWDFAKLFPFDEHCIYCGEKYEKF